MKKLDLELESPLPKNDVTRIAYIDAIKGFTILWVVIYHFGSVMPDWFAVGFRMPLFFFMSGIFFRPRPFKVFFVRRINTLLVPLMFWLLASWLFVLFKYEFLVKFFNIAIVDPDAPTWGLIGNLTTMFNIANSFEYQPFLNNDSLWFLIVLFNMQMLYYGIRKLTSNYYWILAICAVLYVVGVVMERNGINGMMLICRTFNYIIYYALGSLIGQWYMNLIHSKQKRTIIGLSSLAILLGLSFLDLRDGFFGYATISLNIRIACFVALVFIVFQAIGSSKF